MAHKLHNILFILNRQLHRIENLAKRTVAYNKQENKHTHILMDLVIESHPAANAKWCGRGSGGCN